MMNNNTSTYALKEEEIELELGLSIGRGYRRPEKLKPVKKETVRVQLTRNSNSDGSEADPYDKNHRHQNNNLQSYPRSSVSPSFVIDAEHEIDSRVEREIQATRRQEVKKKIEEKQHKKRMSMGHNGDYVNEFDMKERKCKRNKVGDAVAGSGRDDEIENLNGKMTCVQNRYCNLVSNPTSSIASSMCQVGPMQNLLPPLQCVPITNGSAYPYMMRCWAQSGAGVGSQRNVIRPSENRSLGPIRAMSESVLSLSMCSSSTVSENHSSSQQQGGSGSDTTSNSNVSFAEQNHTKERAENAAWAHLLESAESINKSTNRIYQPASDAIESKPKEEPISGTKPHNPSRNLVSTPQTTRVPIAFRETKGNVGKPPKPVISNPNTTPFPLMPFVSTTGDGPNGKTINGFLYRYTKSEVDIICVCHGTTFSPAEFVRHAGCMDLSQPLRHITVIPSAF